MIFAHVHVHVHLQRAALAFVFLRRHTAHALQHRIEHLVNFIRLEHPPDTSTDSPWHSVSNLPTLDSAVTHLESLSSPSEDYDLSPPPLDTVNPPPIWLLAGLCSKVKSPADAEKFSHLIITHLPHVPPSLRPPVLILVVHVLYTFRALPALEPVIKLFIDLPLFHEHWYFNRLLRTFALYTDSRTDGRYVARLTILLLKAMTERELALTKKTYRFLLQNPYFTTELAEELRQRMIRDKVVPDRAHLESFLHIFARRGSVHDANACARAIYDLDRRREKTLDVNVSKPSGLAETDQAVSSTTVEYLTHLVHENSQRRQFDADVEWQKFVRKEHSLRFRNNQETSAAAWAARLFSLSRTRSLSPQNLLAFLEWSRAQRFPFRTHTTLTYTIVLSGLLRKSAYSLALEVWERYYARKLQLDYVAFGVGVEVLTTAGHPDRALALLETIVSGYMPRRSRWARRNSIRHFVTRNTVPVSLVTGFMRILSVTNPSAALRVWDYMGILYDATPDARTFAVMLDSARRATLRGESFTGAMKELGFDFQFRLPFTKPTMDAQPELTDAGSLAEARRKAYERFEKSLVVNDGDMWGRERAWRRAHRIFTSALLAGWPALADVRPPARAVRTSIESVATSPLRELKNFLSPPKPDDEDGAEPTALHKNTLYTDADTELDPNLHHLPPLLPIHPRGAYPSFAPDNVTFHSAILLLGGIGVAGEIPRTLAWMRALGITPQPRTLAYALVFWAEVSLGAPLLESLRSMAVVSHIVGDVGQGEYARLVRWMAEWVGAENVPDEAAVGEAVRGVDLMRRAKSWREYLEEV